MTQPKIETNIGNATIRQVGEKIYLLQVDTKEKHPWENPAFLQYTGHDKDGVVLEAEAFCIDLGENGPQYIHVSGLLELSNDCVYHAQMINGTRFCLRFFVYAEDI